MPHHPLFVLRPRSLSDDDDSDDSVGTAGSKLMSSVPARKSSFVEQFNNSFSSEPCSSKEKDTAKKRQASTGSSSINVCSTTYSKLSQISLTHCVDVAAALTKATGKRTSKQLGNEATEAGAATNAPATAADASSAPEKQAENPKKPRGRPPKRDELGNRIHPVRKK